MTLILLYIIILNIPYVDNAIKYHPKVLTSYYLYNTKILKYICIKYLF